VPPSAPGPLTSKRHTFDLKEASCRLTSKRHTFDLKEVSCRLTSKTQRAIPLTSKSYLVQHFFQGKNRSRAKKSTWHVPGRAASRPRSSPSVTSMLHVVILAKLATCNDVRSNKKMFQQHRIETKVGSTTDGCVQTKVGSTADGCGPNS